MEDTAQLSHLALHRLSVTVLPRFQLLLTFSVFLFEDHSAFPAIGKF
jgi:hypothetical protein